MTKKLKSRLSLTGSAVKSKDNESDYLPRMIVFDLDDCLWTPEMHELYGLPSKPITGNLNPDDGNDEMPRKGRKQPKRGSKTNFTRDDTIGEIGVIGMQCPGSSQTVYLYEGARKALREIGTNPKYKEVLIAVASTSLEPSYSHHCLDHIEILPGVTIRNLLDHDEVGRSGHLTSRKTTHFKALHEESNISYEEMLFFDDCNWGDHVKDLEDAYGVTGQRTPNGLQMEEFYAGLEKYRKKIQAREKKSGIDNSEFC